MATATKGKTFEDFQALHDPAYIVPRKIKTGLESLGPDAWEYEIDFRKRCGINSPNVFAPYRDEFKEFCVELPGKSPVRVWCGSKKLAEKIRSTRV